MIVHPQHPIPLRGGDEYDGLTKAKKYHAWRPGERKQLKKQYNKRVRNLIRVDVWNSVMEEKNV